MPRMDWHQLLGLPNPGDFSILTKELFGEFLGTLWIVFFGCGSVLAPGLPSNDVVQVSIFLGISPIISFFDVCVKSILVHELAIKVKFSVKSKR